MRLRRTGLSDMGVNWKLAGWLFVGTSVFLMGVLIWFKFVLSSFPSFSLEGLVVAMSLPLLIAAIFMGYSGGDKT